MKNRTRLTWFALGHFANDWPICSLWLIVPTVGIAMELSPAEVGLLFTICNVGGALAYLPAGILADHVSNRGRLLVATFWWVSVGYLLAAMAPGFWSLALLLAIAGMGDAAWHPIATGVLARDSKERRAHVLGIHAIGGSLAEVLSPLAVGFLLAYIDWREALAISVLPTAFMGICFFWVARAIPRVEKKAVSRHDMLALLNLWRQGNGLRMVVMICLYNMALMALLSMIPLYLADRHGFGPEAAGIAFSTMLIVGALGPALGRQDLRHRWTSTDRGLGQSHGGIGDRAAGFPAFALGHDRRDDRRGRRAGCDPRRHSRRNGRSHRPQRRDDAGSRLRADGRHRCARRGARRHRGGGLLVAHVRPRRGLFVRRRSSGIPHRLRPPAGCRRDGSGADAGVAGVRVLS